MQQDQFLDVIDRDEAERRFRAALDLRPLGAEAVSLDAALGRVVDYGGGGLWTWNGFDWTLAS